MTARRIKHFPTCPRCGASCPHRAVPNKKGWVRCILCNATWDNVLARAWRLFAMGQGPQPEEA